MYGSPMLQSEEDKRLYECPVGKVLRETPWVYDIYDLLNYAENTGIGDFQRLPAFAQQALRLGRSEQSRLLEARQREQKVSRDSKAGMRAVSS